MPIGSGKESSAPFASRFVLPLIRQIESELQDLIARERSLLGDKLLSDRFCIRFSHHPGEREVGSKVRSHRARSVVADHGMRLSADHAQMLEPATIT